MGKNVAFAWGGAFNLGDDRGTAASQCRHKIARWRSVLCRGNDRDIADELALSRDFFALGRKNVIEDRAHLDFDSRGNSVPFVMRRISSITSSARSDSIICRAVAMPSASDAALPPT